MRASRIVALACAAVLAAAGCSADNSANDSASEGTAGNTTGSPAPNPPPSSQAKPAPLGVNGAQAPKLTWKPCQANLQCADARVPVSYREPGGESLQLAVAKLPATDQAHRIGSLFVNYGGPGTDGVSELARFGARYPADLRAKFDLVSFDPRGIGGSSAISCPGAAPATTGPSPLRQSQRAAFYTASGAIGRACKPAANGLLAHLSTANVARDMELLRQSVGDEGLNFLGYSYGTYLGGTYASLFPGKVRAITLDGTLDLVANSTGGPGQQDAPVDVRADVARSQSEELDAFFTECTKAGPRCAFSAGDPRRAFADIVAKLSTGPIGGTSLPVLLRTVDSALYQSGRWQRLAQTLAALAPAAKGAAERNPPLLDPYLPTHSTGFLAVQCVDSELPQDTAAYDRLAASESQRVAYFGPASVFNLAQCIGWPAHDEDRYLGPWNQPRKNPILVVNNRHDPATPLHNAQATAAQLGNGRVLTVDGYGHTSLDVHSACASAAMSKYFQTLAMPAEGTVCAPDNRPFG